MRAYTLYLNMRFYCLGKCLESCIFAIVIDWLLGIICRVNSWVNSDFFFAIVKICDECENITGLYHIILFSQSFFLAFCLSHSRITHTSFWGREDLFTQTHFTGCHGCPDGWLDVNGSCFYFHQDQSMPWEDARRFCETSGGSLAKIGSAKELRAFYEYILTYSKSCINEKYIFFSITI